MAIRKNREKVTKEDLVGGFKADSGKEDIALIPWQFIMALAALFTTGAKKYSPYNWYLGMDYSRVYSAMMRHALKWWGGEKYDETDGQHHLISVAWCACVLFIYDTMPERFAKFDDRLHNQTDEMIRGSVNTEATK